MAASTNLTDAGCRQAGRRQVYKEHTASIDDKAEAGSNYSEHGRQPGLAVPTKQPATLRNLRHASLELTHVGCRQAGRRQVYEDDAVPADDEAEAGSNYFAEADACLQVQLKAACWLQAAASRQLSHWM